MKEFREPQLPAVPPAAAPAVPPTVPPTAAPVRPRGRRPSAGRRTKGAIVAAAAEEFAASGYDAVSMRAIARRAGVDPALVHHYFDDKAELFAATIDAPVRPDILLAGILDGPRETVGARIVSTVLHEWDRPEVAKRGVVLLRGVLGQAVATSVVRQFLVREIIHRIAASLPDDDAELRASLAASQLLGMIVARYVLKLPKVQSATVEELVARVGPVLQWHLVGFAPLGAVVGRTG